MNRNQVRAVLSNGHLDGGRRDGVLPLASPKPRLGPVSGEIVVPAGADQAAHLFCTQISLYTAQAHCAHTPHIYPRPDYRQNVRVIQLWQRFFEFKISDFHNSSLTAPLMVSKGGSIRVGKAQGPLVPFGTERSPSPKMAVFTRPGRRPTKQIPYQFPSYPRRRSTRIFEPIMTRAGCSSRPQKFLR